MVKPGRPRGGVAVSAGVRLASGGGRTIQDVADVHGIHLTSFAFIAGVERDHPAVATGAGVKIDPMNPRLGGVLQLGKRYEQPARPVVEKQVLVSLYGIGVGEDPVVLLAG